MKKYCINYNRSSLGPWNICESSSLSVDGKIFRNIEHYYIFNKLLFFGIPEDKLLGKLTSKQDFNNRLVYLSTNIQRTDKNYCSSWNNIRKDIMKDGIKFRLSQQDEFKTKLLNIEKQDTIFAVSKINVHWGVTVNYTTDTNFDIDDFIEGTVDDSMDFFGLNIYGELLDELRKGL